jgi:ribosome-binding protein aMBF1 (putative translation factor)
VAAINVVVEWFSTSLRHQLDSPRTDWVAIVSILKVSMKMSDKSILKVSIRQIKAARALLGWSQDQLAVAAKVSIPTIKRLESHDGLLGGRADTGEKIEAALRKAGVEFIDENGGGMGVRLRKSMQKRAGAE